jgi:hypothetical protein
MHVYEFLCIFLYIYRLQAPARPLDRDKKGGMDLQVFLEAYQMEVK